MATSYEKLCDEIKELQGKIEEQHLKVCVRLASIETKMECMGKTAQNPVLSNKQIGVLIGIAATLATGISTAIGKAF